MKTSEREKAKYNNNVYRYEFEEKQREKRVRQFKRAITDKYISADISYRFKNVYDVINNGYIAFYLKLCSDFALDPFDLGPLNSLVENRKENLLENRILSMYCDLNMAGRERFFEMLYDLWSIDKYKRI